MSRLDAWSPKILSVLRIISALLFMEHGLMKLIHLPAPQPGVPDPLPPILLVGAWLELVGGALIALGLFTRPAAFILSGEMAVAYFMFHMPRSFWPGVNQGEDAILFCFIFFYLVFVGAGPWSLDAAIGRRRSA
jgi:putative oxidoreductase